MRRKLNGVKNRDYTAETAGSPAGEQQVGGGVRAGGVAGRSTTGYRLASRRDADAIPCPAAGEVSFDKSGVPPFQGGRN